MTVDTKEVVPSQRMHDFEEEIQQGGSRMDNKQSHHYRRGRGGYGGYRASNGGGYRGSRYANRDGYGSSERHGRTSHQAYNRAPTDRLPRTLEDAITEDKLLTMNQFQRMKQGTEEEYEGYVKRHQQAFLERFYQKHSNEAWFKERFGSEAMKKHTGKLIELNESTCLDYEDLFGWKIQETDRKGQETILRVCNEGQSPIVWPEQIKEAVIEIKYCEKGIYHIESSKQSLQELKQEHQGEIIMGKARQYADFDRPVWIYKDAKGEDTNYQPNNIVKCISSHWNTQERITTDLELAKKLVEAVEPGIEFVPMEDKKRELDRLIVHLRKVHSICYYCAIQCDCHEELLQTCGPVHLRETSGNQDDTIDMEWFDRKIMRLIDAFSLHLQPISLDYFLEKHHVTNLDPTKFGCRHCSKLFKGADFVVKHLQLKHADIVQGECTTAFNLLNNLLANPGDCVLPATILPYHQLIAYNTPKRRGSLDQRHAGKRLALPHHDKSNDIRRPLRKYVDLDAPSTAGSVVDIDYNEEA